MRKEQQNQVITLNPVPRRIRLTSAAHIRQEMASIYTACRRGEMAVSDGTKYIFMLTALGRQISDVVLEERIQQLEQAQERKK